LQYFKFVFADGLDQILECRLRNANWRGIHPRCRFRERRKQSTHIRSQARGLFPIQSELLERSARNVGLVTTT
jgi:hypothetical protein